MRESITVFPDYFDARFWLANELIRTGAATTRSSNSKSPAASTRKTSASTSAFGELLMQQANTRVAARVFAEAARLSPTDPQPLLQRGTALSNTPRHRPVRVEEGRRDAPRPLNEAEKSLADADRLSGTKLAAVHLQLARVYEKRGDRARAADELELYLRQTPRPQKRPRHPRRRQNAPRAASRDKKTP